MTASSTLTAWITISDYPHAPPGMSVMPDGSGIDVASRDIDLADHRGGIDKDRADEVLDELGYRRAGEWIGSGDQWAAHVEPATEI